MFFSSLSPALAIEEYAENDTYIAYRELSNEEKADIFLKGYKKIICYDNTNRAARATLIRQVLCHRIRL